MHVYYGAFERELFHLSPCIDPYRVIFDDAYEVSVKRQNIEWSLGIDG